jgi:hypothetical protein
VIEISTDETSFADTREGSEEVVGIGAVDEWLGAFICGDNAKGDGESKWGWPKKRPNGVGAQKRFSGGIGEGLTGMGGIRDFLWGAEVLAGIGRMR